MAVFRVEKDENFTTMSNVHLRDKNLSLKAKGLLSMFLSLPDEWHYSIQGLSKICLEGTDGIRSALLELEKQGYLKRNRVRMSDGTLEGIEYVIYEVSPKTDKPMLVNPTLDKPMQVSPALENPTGINKDITNTKELNTDKSNTEGEKGPRHKYGLYKNVLLSDEQMAKLKTEFPYDYNEWIERVSEYVASHGFRENEDLRLI